jgi:hypothetical protein
MGTPSQEALADSACTCRGATLRHRSRSILKENGMKPKKASTGGRDMKRNEHENDTKHKATPSPEVQMEDAGTPASGNSGMGGRANAAESAMKQTSKTSAEASGKKERR